MVVSLFLAEQDYSLDLQQAFTIPERSASSVVIDPKTFNFAFTDSGNVTYHVTYLTKKVTKL